MGTVRLLLCLAIVTVSVRQISCEILEGGPNGPIKGCVTGKPQKCKAANVTFKCTPPQSGPENGGADCPPAIGLDNDGPGPAGLSHCDLGPWGPCELLPGSTTIMVRRRSPINPSQDITECQPLIELCSTNQPVDCVMTEWSIWYPFPSLAIEVRVRFVLVEPTNGGAPCPHDMEVCTYGGWSVWVLYAGGCYRYHTGIGSPAGTVCPTRYDVKAAPCIDTCPPWGQYTPWVQIPGSDPCLEERSRTSPTCPDTDWDRRICSCPPWTNWTPWAPVGGGACTGEEERFRHSATCPSERETRSCACTPWSVWTPWVPVGGGPCTGLEERYRYSSTCQPERQTRPCNTCPWDNWMAWTSKTLNPCVDIRWRHRDPPCTPEWESEERPCSTPCLPWTVWTPWAPVGGGPCTGLEERYRYSSTCQPERQTRPCNTCPWDNWMAWTSKTLNPCIDIRWRHRDPPCTPEWESEERPCPTPCLPWSVWSAWAPVSVCSLLGEEERTRTSATCPPERETRPCVCDPWTVWSDWTNVGGGSTCVTGEERFKYSSTCIPDKQTRPCSACPWDDWLDWTIKTVDPCVQIRWRRRVAPCDAEWESQEQSCFASCSLPVLDPLDAQIREARQGEDGNRRKRDVPWCREEPWIIYGYGDCFAVKNETYSKCIHENCENCLPPTGTSLICIPDKFTTIHLGLMCPGGVSDSVAIVKPIACTCFQVQNTCDKFEGPCA